MSDASPTRSWKSAGNIVALTAILGVALLITKVGCDRARVMSTPNAGLGTIPMTIGSKAFELEIANDDETRMRGLMQRDSMPDDHGMIFVFPNEEDRGFWMKNTRIPLDIIYVSAAKQVVSIKTMEPYSRANVPSDGPAKYAIELNAGAAEKTGVKPGDTLTIPKPALDTQH